MVGIVFTGAYVAYVAERGVNKEFATFGDSLWWAVVTITTVGYGDVVPITRTGRVTAVLLMISGVGLLGVLAGTLSSFFGFGQPSASDQPKASGATAYTTPVIPEDELTSIRNQLAELDQQLADLQERERT